MFIILSFITGHKHVGSTCWFCCGLNIILLKAKNALLEKLYFNSVLRGTNSVLYCLHTANCA